MAETDLHRQLMTVVIETLQDYLADDPQVYVTGNLLLYYEEGNPRKHVSPDVFVVRGVPKLPPRNYYLLWKERKPPQFVIEITSKTTRREDQTKKLALYRDLLKVREYFQFDPTEDYLKPPFQGHRLVAGDYEPIRPIQGRLPSQILGLHLERDGADLRFYDPVNARRLLTRQEALLVRQEAIDAAKRQLSEKDAEIERLRRELDALRRSSLP